MRRLADTQRALQAVERLQAKLKERGEVPTEEKLSLLRSVLQSPLFHQILALQKSVQHLRDQVWYNPCNTSSDLIFLSFYHLSWYCSLLTITLRQHKSNYYFLSTHSLETFAFSQSETYFIVILVMFAFLHTWLVENCKQDFL